MNTKAVDNNHSKNIFVVDIDGTIADITHRLHYIDGTDVKKNWDKFYSESGNDSPIWEVLLILRVLYHTLGDDMKLVFLTGRPERYRELTEKWIEKYVGEDFFNSFHLVMRKDEDYRPDYEVKFERFKDAGFKIEDVYAVFEDRQQMVDAWRAKGVFVFQVSKGNY